jgi:hypothetical protein
MANSQPNGARTTGVSEGERPCPPKFHCLLGFIGPWNERTIPLSFRPLEPVLARRVSQKCGWQIRSNGQNRCIPRAWQSAKKAAPRVELEAAGSGCPMQQ